MLRIHALLAEYLNYELLVVDMAYTNQLIGHFNHGDILPVTN